jgi:hypothetical protein
MASEPARAFLPARRAPLIYFGFAHGCLFVAFAALALRPAALGGFYYHPRLIAVVHLVTLGFLTSAILGALYLVGPLAFRIPLREGRWDLAAALAWTIGVSAIASHFWRERYAGLAWSGTLALLAPLWVGGRVLARLPRAPVPIEAKLPVALALVNLYVAGGLGVLLGLNKHDPFLGVLQLDAVHAHLHLGAVGFATLMVVGAGYRMLPMALPAAMPRGRLALASGLVIEAGTLGLASALLFARRLVPAFALLLLAGLALFLSRVALMLRRRRPPPAERPRPDWPVAHVLQSLAYLVATAAVGLYLAFSAPSEAALRVAFAYGVCGLVGFLCQLVVGIEARLLPLSFWLQAFAGGGYRALPASLHTAVPPAGAAAVVVLWTFGVPSLAAGLSLDRARCTGAGAGALALAVLVVAVSGARALRRLRVPADVHGPHGSPP